MPALQPIRELLVFHFAVASHHSSEWRCLLVFQLILAHACLDFMPLSLLPGQDGCLMMLMVLQKRWTVMSVYFSFNSREITLHGKPQSVEENRFLRIPQNFNDTGVNFSSNVSDAYRIESKAKQRLALNANSRRTLKERLGTLHISTSCCALPSLQLFWE